MIYLNKIEILNIYLNKIENGYRLNNRNVYIFNMFHLIWAIVFIIKLYKSVANAPKINLFRDFSRTKAD